MELGATATAFESRTYGDSLARCQRYYQKFIQGSYVNLVGSFSYYVPWKVSMRVAPTPTTSGGTAASVSTQSWNETDIHGSRYSMTTTSSGGGYYGQTVELTGAEL
jgi:hypothetical protein